MRIQNFWSFGWVCLRVGQEGLGKDIKTYLFEPKHFVISIWGTRNELYSSALSWPNKPPSLPFLETKTPSLLVPSFWPGRFRHLRVKLHTLAKKSSSTLQLQGRLSEHNCLFPMIVMLWWLHLTCRLDVIESSRQSKTDAKSLRLLGISVRSTFLELC